MSHIFISYSKQNKDYARKLAEQLKQQGFEVWIDDRIDYGDTWERVIFKAIDECMAFLVIMTPESYASDWVLRECQYADKRKKPQFPMLLDGEEFPRYVSTQYADVRGGKLPGEDFLRRLEKSVGRTLNSLPNPPSNSGDGIKFTPARTKIASIMDGRLKKIPDQSPSFVFAPADVSAILPQPFEWCVIPAGEVRIEYNETDHETFDVPLFGIAKYPITNAQYQVFVDAEDGYCDLAWWGYSDEAKMWRREHKEAQETGFEGDDLPRTNVSWYEAVAFCQWIASRLDLRLATKGELVTQTMMSKYQNIALPTEQQWQRAAQSDDGRRYPWGVDGDASRCNVRESGRWQPTPVQTYPNGISPFGVMDMSGNVWEWCLTSNISENINTIHGNSPRVLRGGYYYGYIYDARCVFRATNSAENFSTGSGFRIAVSPQYSGTGLVY